LKEENLLQHIDESIRESDADEHGRFSFYKGVSYLREYTEKGVENALHLFDQLLEKQSISFPLKLEIVAAKASALAHIPIFWMYFTISADELREAVLKNPEPQKANGALELFTNSRLSYLAHDWRCEKKDLALDKFSLLQEKIQMLSEFVESSIERCSFDKNFENSLLHRISNAKGNYFLNIAGIKHQFKYIAGSSDPDLGDDVEKALGCFKKCIDYDKPGVEVWSNIATCHFYNGSYEECRKNCILVLQAVPNYNYAHYRYLQSLLKEAYEAQLNFLFRDRDKLMLSAVRYASSLESENVTIKNYRRIIEFLNEWKEGSEI